MKTLHFISISCVSVSLLLAVCQIAKADQNFQKLNEYDLLRAGRALSVGTCLTSNFQMPPVSQMPPLPKTVQNFGVDSMKIDQNVLKNGSQKWSEKDLLKTGQALSVGSTLTSSMQMTPTFQIQPPLKTMQNFGFDSTKISQKELNNHVVTELGRSTINHTVSYARDIAVGQRTGAILGAAGTLINFNIFMWNCSRVGSGRADIDVLKSMVPHIVMGVDALRGPKIIPNQTFITPINYSYNDWALKGQMSGTKITHQEFSTTAPGKIGNYGFDPYTDRLVTQTSSHIIKIENFDGSRFNRMYQNSILKIDTPKFYPSSIPKFEPPKYYTPPRIYTPMPVYTPPRIYTPMPVYTPPRIYTPMPVYTPPRIYTPPPSYRR